jgi:capsular polysaccharide biosynthesis protein
MSKADQTTIDVGAWFATLARNWWLILAFVALGAAAGALVAVVSPSRYTATSTVYIGQTTDANGSPMAGLNSNVRAATQLVASQVVLKEAADRTGDGMTAGKLRRGTTVETPSSTVRTSSSVVNIVIMHVTDTDPERAAAAANNLADVLLERIGGGVDEKIAVLDEQLTTSKEALAAAQDRAQAAQRALAAIAREGGSAADRALAAAPYLAVVQAAATEQQSLVSSTQRLELQLLTARQVEQPRILHEAAVPDGPSAPSMSLNAAAGALAGLVIGIVVAFARRRTAARA